MDFEALHVDQTGAVLHITLNRPEVRNAMSRQMVAELEQVLRAAQDSADGTTRGSRRGACVAPGDTFAPGPI